MHIIRNLLYLSIALILSACSSGFFGQAETATSSTKSKPAICQSENLSMASQEIYFDVDSASLNAEALEIVDEIVQNIKQSKPAYVKIIGYADRSGKPAYNTKLSTRRAKAVAAALKKKGVSSRLIRRETCGEESASVPTQDGVKLRENRRVVVQLQKK